MAVTKVLRRGKVFRGWYIVAVAFLAQFTAGGIQAYTLGVFMKPMIEDLGWTRGAISGVQTAGVVVNGLCGLFIGGILDRRGGRSLMLFGAVLSGIGFMALSLMQDIWHFYLIRGVLIAVGNLCLGGMVTNVTVSNWFVRNRGRAIATAAMGIGFGAAAFPPLAQALIDSLGWRNSWVVFGALVWVVMLVPVALFIRRRPEDMGLRPDGDPPSGVNERPLSRVQIAAIKADVEWKSSEAMRTSTLWMIIIAFGFANIGVSAQAMHLVPYVSDLGFTTAVAASAQSAVGIGSLATKILWGFLVERLDVRAVSVFSFICAALGIGLLLRASSVEMVLLSGLVAGVGMGGTAVIQEVVWANYFGRITLGAVRRIGMPFMMVFSAGGPLMAGVVYDRTASYRIAFVAIICAYGLASILIALLRPPKHPRRALQ